MILGWQVRPWENGADPSRKVERKEGLRMGPGSPCSLFFLPLP